MRATTPSPVADRTPPSPMGASSRYQRRVGPSKAHWRRHGGILHSSLWNRLTVRLIHDRPTHTRSRAPAPVSVPMLMNDNATKTASTSPELPAILACAYHNTKVPNAADRVADGRFDLRSAPHQSPGLPRSPWSAKLSNQATAALTSAASNRHLCPRFLQQRSSLASPKDRRCSGTAGPSPPQ